MGRTIGLPYLRVSTGAQAAKKLPLKTQRLACLKLAEREGLTVQPGTDIYQDKVSGRKISGRHGLHQLLERCKTDSAVAAVIVYDISRLSRNAGEYAMMRALLNKQGIRLISVIEPLPTEESAASWIMEYMLAGFAEFRSRQDGEKVQRAMQNKVKSGGWCGKARYGYKNVQDEGSSHKRKRWIEPREDEAPWVRRIHELYATGRYSFRSLAQKVEQEGMPFRGSRQVHHSRIEQILQDETYIGVVDWGGIRCEKANHQPLVDRKTFQRNQAIIRARTAGTCRKRKHFFAIRSLEPVCGECGSRWTAGFHRGRRGKQYKKYSCRKWKDGRVVPCRQPSVSVDELDSDFGRMVDHLQLSPRAVERVRSRIKELSGTAAKQSQELKRSLNKRLTEYARKADRLLNALLASRIPEDQFQKKNEALTREAAQLRKRLETTGEEIRVGEEILSRGLTLVEKIGFAYRKAKREEDRALLAQALFERITIKNQAVETATLRVPFDFLEAPWIRTDPRFKLEASGGHRKSLRKRLRDLPELVDHHQQARIDEALRVVESLGLLSAAA